MIRCDFSISQTVDSTIIVVSVASFFLFAYLMFLPAEDAVILYDYARNFAEKGVITYGGLDQPIEGATDFLWMVVISFFSKIGVNEYLTAICISGIASCLLVKEVSNRTNFIIALLAIFGTPFLLSSAAGFSTLAFSAVFVFTLKLWLERSYRTFYFFVLLLCLIRPDGVVWAFGVCAITFYQQLRLKNWEGVRDAVVILIIPGIVYFLARAAYFQEWLPLPFLVKSSSVRDYGLFYADSLYPVLSIAAPSLFVAFVTRNRPTIVTLLAILLVPTFFFLAMKLEQNIGNRFMAPLFFGALYIIGRHSKKAALLLVVLVIAATARISFGTFLNLLDSRNENIFNLSRDLAITQGKMLTTEAGRLAYYSGWEVHDSWGLNTPKYATKPPTRLDLQQANYDLLAIHCDIDLLVRDYETGSVRSWHNMCVSLTSFIKDSHYDIYLVPFYRGDRLTTNVKRLMGLSVDECVRHDIFALNPKSNNYDIVVSRLISNHGFEFDPNIRYERDSICEDID